MTSLRLRYCIPMAHSALHFTRWRVVSRLAWWLMCSFRDPNFAWDITITIPVSSVQTPEKGTNKTHHHYRCDIPPTTMVDNIRIIQIKYSLDKNPAPITLYANWIFVQRVFDLNYSD